MRKVLGITCILLGFLCILVSVGFVFYNQYEARQGETISRDLLENVQFQMQQGTSEAPEAENAPNETLPQAEEEAAPRQMQTVSAGGYESIGILSIPVLELELPVLTDWSYEKLRSAPCHYYGSYFEPNFVIAAHNYPAHFGRLSQLLPGDLVVFTDVTGTVYCYEVVLLETLAPTATEEMITAGFDLSLYTCTPGGASRVTVRCNAVT